MTRSSLVLAASVAALFGCAVLTGVGAVVNTARVRAGASVAVVGLGGVGLASVLGAATTNYSRMDRADTLWYRTSVTIGYDAPWRQVHAMLCQAAERTQGIRRAPPPFVLQSSLSDFYVEYRLVCQAIPTDPRPRAELLSALHANVQDVFNEHGVQIMSPHYLGDPAEMKVVPKAKWYASPAEPPR